MRPDDLAPIAAPTLVLAGDRDAIRLAHTCAIYEALPAGRLAIVPGASHAVPLEQPALVGRLVTDFLASPDPPPTLMPTTAHQLDRSPCSAAAAERAGTRR